MVSLIWEGDQKPGSHRPSARGVGSCMRWLSDAATTIGFEAQSMFRRPFSLRIPPPRPGEGATTTCEVKPLSKVRRPLGSGGWRTDPTRHNFE